MPTELPTVKREGLDFSILSSYGRCPRLAFYNYVLCRAADVENYPISFGVAYHTFRETLDSLYQQWIIQDGEEFEDLVVQERIWTVAYAVASKDWQDPPIEHKKGYLDLSRLRETCRLSFLNWVEERQRNAIVVVASEVAFDLKLPSGRRFFGRIDRVQRWNNRLWIRDYKTVGYRQDWSRAYNPNHQFTGYTWAGEQLSGERIDGVIVDVVYNVKTKGPEFHPTLANRTADDIRQWLQWIEWEYDNWERSMETGNWPMRTNGCNDYGGCFFRDCCSQGNWAAIERWLEDRTVFSVWDPMNPELEKGLPE